jgi:hypothetical protein
VPEPDRLLQPGDAFEPLGDHLVIIAAILFDQPLTGTTAAFLKIPTREETSE